MLRAKLPFITSPNLYSLPTKLAMLLFPKRRCCLLLTLRVTNTVNTCASIAATRLKPRCTTRPPDTNGPLGRLPEHKRTFLLVSNTGEYFKFVFVPFCPSRYVAILVSFATGELSKVLVLSSMQFQLKILSSSSFISQPQVFGAVQVRCSQHSVYFASG